MSVKIALTTIGQIIGDVDDFMLSVNEVNGDIVIKNPALLAPTPQGVQLTELTQTSKDKRHALTLNANLMLFKTLLDPMVEIENLYNQHYGSGIQIAKSF